MELVDKEMVLIILKNMRDSCLDILKSDIENWEYASGYVRGAFNASILQIEKLRVIEKDV